MLIFYSFLSRWLAGQYGECSVTCGEGVQTRSLRCARIENGRPVEVSDSMCDQQIRPPSDMPCDGGVCPAPAQWVKGSWSEVSLVFSLYSLYLDTSWTRTISPQEFTDEIELKYSLNLDLCHWQINKSHLQDLYDNYCFYF